VRRYRSRVTSTLGSHLDIRLALTPPVPGAAGAELGSQAFSDSAGRVAAARERAGRRLAGTPWRLNSHIPAVGLRRSYLPPPGAMAAVRRAVDLGQISVPAAHRVLRVAWTLADLAGQERLGPHECAQALALHLGDSR